MSVFQRVVFDTAALGNHADPAVRARIWAEHFAPVITSMDVGFSDTDCRVIGQHNILFNDTIVVGEMFSSSFVGRRSKSHINRDDEDHVYLSFNIGTTAQMSRQLGRETEVRPGTAVMAIMEAGIEALAPESGHCISLKIPSATVAQWGLSAPDLACRPLDCTGADYRLLAGYARTVIEAGAQLGALSAAAAAQHLIDLTGHWLGASDRVRERESDETTHHARLAAIRHAIGKQASDPRVSLQSIALHLGIPPRTLQHTLARAGESFSHILTSARLRRAHVLLLDPAHDDMSVGDIAFVCGFLDVTSFYRTFRATYDTTPKAFREQRGTMQG